MNNIEAIRSNSASPAIAPNGLESSGPQVDLNPQEISSLVENAQGIAFYRRAVNGIRKFADYTGRIGEKISPKNLVILGQIGVASLAIACGGSDSNASTSGVQEPQLPKVEVKLTAEPATATPQVTVTEAPKAVLTPEPVKLLSPAEITALVERGLLNVPASDNKTNAISFVRQLEQSMPRIGEIIGSPLGVANQYVNAAKLVRGFACEYPDNSALPEAFFAIKDVTLHIIKEETKNRVLVASSVSDFTREFQIPSDCKNPFLLAGNAK